MPKDNRTVKRRVEKKPDLTFRSVSLHKRTSRTLDFTALFLEFHLPAKLPRILGNVTAPACVKG